MISLSDDELAAITDAARPLHPRERSAFLAEVVGELAKYEVLGPGVIHRAVVKIQRQHLAPRMGHNVGSKYGH